MKLNWKGHGRIVHGNYYLEWNLLPDGSMYYTIWCINHSNLILLLKVK